MRRFPPPPWERRTLSGAVEPRRLSGAGAPPHPGGPHPGGPHPGRGLHLRAHPRRAARGHAEAVLDPAPERLTPNAPERLPTPPSAPGTQEGPRLCRGPSEAVAEGFEPSVSFPTLAFEASSFGRSDTLPRESLAQGGPWFEIGSGRAGSPLPEEGRQLRRALLFEDALDHLGAVVEPPVAHDVPQRNRPRPPSRRGPRRRPARSGTARGARAHRARLQGDDERAAGQPPLAESCAPRARIARTSACAVGSPVASRSLCPAARKAPSGASTTAPTGTSPADRPVRPRPGRSASAPATVAYGICGGGAHRGTAESVGPPPRHRGAGRCPAGRAGARRRRH